MVKLGGKMTELKCPSCGNKIKLGETSLTLKRGKFSAEFKNIPAQICSKCGEVYIPGSIAEPLSDLAEKSFEKVSEATKKLKVSA